MFWLNLAKIQKNSGKICDILEKNSKISAKNSAIFNENFEIRERCNVVGSPLACPLGRLGPFPHPLVSLVSANHATTLNLVQPPWNFVAEFGIAGNPNKGYSVCSQLNQTEP